MLRNVVATDCLVLQREQPGYFLCLVVPITIMLTAQLKRNVQSTGAGLMTDRCEASVEC